MKNIDSRSRHDFHSSTHDLDALEVRISISSCADSGPGNSQNNNHNPVNDIDLFLINDDYSAYTTRHQTTGPCKAGPQSSSSDSTIVGIVLYLLSFPVGFRLPSNSTAIFRASALPRSTSTRSIKGSGRKMSTARKTNAGRISPYRSVMAPTIAGPNMLEPLSVIAYRA